MTGVQAIPARTGDQRAAPVGVRRWRSAPHGLVGAVLVVAYAFGFAVTGRRVDPTTGVLALAGAVAAGHVLSGADLTVVRVVPDPTLGTWSVSATVTWNIAWAGGGTTGTVDMLTTTAAVDLLAQKSGGLNSAGS